jgi:hypothetical protein
MPSGRMFPRKCAATGSRIEDFDDVPHDYMMQLNAEAEALGWTKAARHQQPHGLDLVSELGDQTRSGWFFHCCNIPTDAVYTELGSNWGAFALTLRRFFSTVHSVEENADKLAFQSIVAGQSQATNMRFIHSGPGNVPLPGSFSDLVLVNLARLDFCNGRLAADARPSRAAIFAEAHRLLTPEGRICVLAAGSAARIRRELNQVGLRHADCYWAWPAADTPRMSGSLDGRSIQYVIRHLSNLMKQKTLRQLVQLTCHIPTPILDRAVQSYSPNLIVVAGKSSSALSAGALPAAGSFVRLTLASRPQRGLHTTCLMLRPQGVEQAIRISEHCDSAGKAEFSSQNSAGIAGRPLRSDVREETGAAARWLADFHQRTFSGYWAPSALEEEIAVLCDNALCYGDNLIEPSLLAQFRRCYSSAVHAGSWPIVTEHGDFTPTNILVDRYGCLHVLDWEYSLAQGNPLIDVGAFCLSLLRRAAQHSLLPTDVDLGSRLAAFLSVYSPQPSLPAALSPAYYVLRWLARVSNPQPGNEMTALYATRTWASLLQPTVAIGLALQENAHHLLVRERARNP